MKTRILRATIIIAALILCMGSGMAHAYSTPPSWSGMKMLTVSFNNGILDVTDQTNNPILAMDTLATGAPNYSARAYGSFDPNQPWKVLNNMAFTRILGWWDPNASKTDGSAVKDKIQAAYGPDAAIWIEALSQSAGLKSYLAVGKFGVNADNTQNVDPNAHGYTGIFGTDGSPAKWKWDYKMDHNVYAVSWDALTPNQLYSATYHVYVGDSAGNKIGPGTNETWTWQAPAAVPGLIDEGNGLIYDKDQNITWYQVSSDRLWTDGGLNTRVSTYIANLNVNGITGWRLPTANKDDIKNNIYNTGELGHLYYVGLGNTLAGGLQYAGPFTGLQAGPYWTGTIAVDGPMKQYYVLDFNSGTWGTDCGMVSMSDGAYVLAVHDGNVGVVDTTAPTVTAFSIPSAATSLTVSISEFAATDDMGVTGYMATESSTAPLASVNGWSADPPATYTFSSAGNKILYAFAKDEAGNVSAPLSAPVAITLPDTTAPTVTSFSIPSSATSLTVSISEFAATDDVGVTGYMATESSTAPLASVNGWSARPPATYTFSSGGAKTLYGYAKDGAGNISAPASAPVTITTGDIIPPRVKTFVMPGRYNALTVPVTTFIGTDNVAVAFYQLTSTSTAPDPAATGWVSTAPENYTFESAGNKDVYAWVKDTSGNISAPKKRRVVVDLPDRTKPTVTNFQMPSQSISLTVPVTTFTAKDNVGVTGYLLTETSTAPDPAATGWVLNPPAGYTFDSQGAKYVNAWVKDGAGNVSAPKRRRVVVDLTDKARPTVTNFQMPSQSISLTVPVTTFTAEDNVGVTGYLLTETSTAPDPVAAGWVSVPPAAYTFDYAGVRRIYAWAKDGAGNVSFARQETVAIDLADKTKPVVTSFETPAASATLTVPVTAFTATDDTGVTGYKLTESSGKPSPAAGWTGTPPASYTFTKQGKRNLYAWARDGAGNISKSVRQQVVVTLSAGSAFQDEDDE